MAELRDRIDITVEELEESLGAVRLPRFIAESEKSFVGRIDSICDEICSDTNKRAIFVSGPTSSGKTTFTLRLSNTINKRGRKAVHLSLDDYYNIKEVKCDKDGRPDFETIDALDVERIQKDIKDLLDGKTVIPPFFDFNVRQQMEGDPSSAISLGDDGVLVVEGLHGLSPKISGECPADKCSKVFIMPYGNVYCDSKLMDSNEIRLLRRIIRDYRHRSAHALATIDYWPMIQNSEQDYYRDYLTKADFHVNSFLAYEPLVIAALAKRDIEEALAAYDQGILAPSVFMERSNMKKDFANIEKAVAKARMLHAWLDMIPHAKETFVPKTSILNEFLCL